MLSVPEIEQKLAKTRARIRRWGLSVTVVVCRGYVDIVQGLVVSGADAICMVKEKEEAIHLKKKLEVEFGKGRTKNSSPRGLQREWRYPKFESWASQSRVRLYGDANVFPSSLMFHTPVS